MLSGLLGVGILWMAMEPTRPPMAVTPVKADMAVWSGCALNRMGASRTSGVFRAVKSEGYI